MKRWVVVFAALSLFSAARLPAQTASVAPGTRFGIWAFAASSDSGEAGYFVNLTGVRRGRAGGYVSAWTRLLHAELQPLPTALRSSAHRWNGETTFRYVLASADFDCAKRNVRFHAFWYFDDHGHTVSELLLLPAEATWTEAPPETSLAKLLDIVCAK